MAAIAEVEVDKATGEVTVKKVAVAHDCGLIINPDGLKNQIEGNVIQGTSRALMEEVKFDASGINSLDWASYPILRYEKIPSVDIVLDRPQGYARARRRRAFHRPGSRGHRQRHLRRHGSAPARGSLHAGARAGSHA